MREIITKKIIDANLHLARGQSVKWASIVHKGWNAPRQITVTLAGAGATFEWHIVVLGRGTETFPLAIRVIHAAPDTTSRISARCILFDSARIAFTGDAVVEKRARRADTHLAFRSLLLSEKAHARTIPSLEIKTDDVRAGHAASVDRLSDDALFYSASRGLSRDEAQTLLARAFLAQDFPASSHAAFRKMMQTI